MAYISAPGTSVTSYLFLNKLNKIFDLCLFLYLYERNAFTLKKLSINLLLLFLLHLFSQHSISICYMLGSQNT